MGFEAQLGLLQVHQRLRNWSKQSSDISHQKLGVEEVSITGEDEYFPPPREIRELLSALETAVHATLAVPSDSRVDPFDREIAASEVLASLSN